MKKIKIDYFENIGLITFINLFTLYKMKLQNGKKRQI